MASLRDYRDKIKSVKSTKKITSAMKMVAASKLRRAQIQAEESQPYAIAIGEMLGRVAQNTDAASSGMPLLAGTGEDKKHLLVVVTADRGLCGGFNNNLIKEARAKIYALQKEGKEISIICVGRKGLEAMRREFRPLIKKGFTGITGGKSVEYTQADKITQFILNLFAQGEFDIASVFYNDFQSVLVQKPQSQQIIPLNISEIGKEKAKNDNTKQADTANTPYDFEPDEETILAKLLPKNLGVQIYRALLDTSAGEQAARMTAMDNATRNAGDMINNLTLEYNRARQAHITKELIEIISGAEAL